MHACNWYKSNSHILQGDGCVLGDPLGEKIVLPQPPQQEISAAVAMAKSPEKVALKRLSLLFTKTEIENGIVTKVRESSKKKQLDTVKTEGIRCMSICSYKVCVIPNLFFLYFNFSVLINYIFPLQSPQMLNERWQRIAHFNLNKCRNTNNNQKKCDYACLLLQIGTMCSGHMFVCGTM